MRTLIGALIGSCIATAAVLVVLLDEPPDTVYLVPAGWCVQEDDGPANCGDVVVPSPTPEPVRGPRA